jgi:hypothetical protein
MLPHLATQAARYDATTHRLHAYTPQGEALCFETPAELTQAIADQRVYASHAVAIAGILLALHHGVARTHYDPGVMIPDVLRTTTPSLLAQTVHQQLQRIDRAHERTARLAQELLTDDDVVTLVDHDGLLATVIHRQLQREASAPRAHLTRHHTWSPAQQATVVLWQAPIHGDGQIAPALFQHLTELLSHQVLGYVLAPHGPQTDPAPADARLCPTAVITSRGIYRADRVSRYLHDSDIGGDMIPLQ